MIIWGSRIRHKDMGQGEFYCPKCAMQRPYRLRRAARYFTLYFIPIFPMQQLGEFVECQVCHTAFEPGVLQMRAGAPRESAKSDLAALMNSLPDKLRGGQPLEYVTRDLTAAGVDIGVARGAVSAAAGAPLRRCANCGLTYVSTISQCSSCGRLLV